MLHVLANTYSIVCPEIGQPSTIVTFGGNPDAEALDAFVGFPIAISAPVERRVTNNAKQQAHGTLDAPSWYGSRIITITIQIFADSEQMRDYRIDQVYKACRISPAGDQTLRWNESNGRDMAIVGKIQNAISTINADGISKDMTFSLIVADPLLYAAQGKTGEVVSTGGSMTLSTVNAGDTESPPDSILIQGPITAPVLTNNLTGAVLSFPTLTVASGSQLSINIRNGIFLSAGSNIYSKLDFVNSSKPDDFSISPGQNTITLSGSSILSGTTSLLINFRDTWI
jgi:hypothetical protein